MVLLPASTWPMKTMFRCSLTVGVIRYQTSGEIFATIRTISEQIFKRILISHGVEFVHNRDGVGLGLLKCKGLG